MDCPVINRLTTVPNPNVLSQSTVSPIAITETSNPNYADLDQRLKIADYTLIDETDPPTIDYLEGKQRFLRLLIVKTQNPERETAAIRMLDGALLREEKEGSDNPSLTINGLRSMIRLSDSRTQAKKLLIKKFPQVRGIGETFQEIIADVVIDWILYRDPNFLTPKNMRK